MKWLTVKAGDIRDRRVFAWKAMECADGFTRRFVYLNVREVYRTDCYNERKGKHYSGWKASRITPLNPDPEAEAEAAAAELIRQANKPPVPTYSISFGSLLGKFNFGTSVEEGDEWKQAKSDEDEEDDE